MLAIRPWFTIIKYGIQIFEFFFSKQKPIINNIQKIN